MNLKESKEGHMGDGGWQEEREGRNIFIITSKIKN